MLITNLIVAFTIFLLGLYVSCRYTSKSFKDGFYNKSDCPDLLVQNEDGLQLLNSNKAKIPGINPVRFNNLLLTQIKMVKIIYIIRDMIKTTNI